jgi:carbon starvation protein CstA
MHYFIDDGHRAHRQTVSGLLLALRWAWKAFLYSPFIVTGYLLATTVLERSDHGALWLGVTLGFAWIQYHIVIGLKKTIQVWRSNHFGSWIPLFLFCTAYTCLLPVWLLLGPLEYLVAALTHGRGNTPLVYLIAACFGLLIYSRYNFLSEK